MTEIPDERPTRQPNRMTGKDYARNGAYFVTVCTKERHCFLGKVQEGSMMLSDVGNMAEEALSKIEAVYPSILLDAFVIMPNHVHMVFVLLSEQHNPSVQRIVQQWKGIVSKQAGFPLWQDRFHDKVIHDVQAYRKIKDYIQSNPSLWEDDRFYEPETQGSLAQSFIQFPGVAMPRPTRKRPMAGENEE